MSMDPDEITAYLLRRARWSANRSRGPGGQHRDKASTRAELTLEIDSLEGLDADVAARLARSLGFDGGSLRISIQDERSLARNQEIAAQRLRERVAEATAPTSPRRATRPSRAARRRRLDSKTRRGAAKRLRQTPVDESG
jgi:ribosome-associated protein